MKGDLKLFQTAALLGLTLTLLGGCFWPCSDCGDCEPLPADTQRAALKLVDDETGELRDPPADTPPEIASLDGAEVEFSTTEGFTVRHSFEERPVVLHFEIVDFWEGGGGAQPDGGGGLGGQTTTPQ